MSENDDKIDELINKIEPLILEKFSEIIKHESSSHVTEINELQNSITNLHPLQFFNMFYSRLLLNLSIKFMLHIGNSIININKEMAEENMFKSNKDAFDRMFEAMEQLAELYVKAMKQKCQEALLEVEKNSGSIN